MKIEPYIFFGGRCAEAMAFYQKHLGGAELCVMTYRGSPAEEGTPPDWLDKAMHASIKVGNQLIMGSDGMPGDKPEPVRSLSLTISVDSDEEARRLFDALSQGGQVTQELQQTFFASSFGMLTDQFGVAWMIIHETPQSAQ
jgi:PhnB protein